MDIEKNINNLKRYIENDFIYDSYKETPNAVISDFDEFCVNHCIDIENVLKELEQDKARIKELEEENGILRRANNIAEDVKLEDIAEAVKSSYEEFMKEFIPTQKVQEKIDELKSINEEHQKQIGELEVELSKTEKMINEMSGIIAKVLIDNIKYLQKCMKKDGKNWVKKHFRKKCEDEQI